MTLEPEVDVPATTPDVRDTVGRDPEHGVVWTDDHVAVEELLEIRLGGLRLAVTMRTPGDDEDLVAGFLFTERVISTADDPDIIARYRAPESDPDSANVMNVLLKGDPRVARTLLRRNFVASSSCGLCGKVTIDAIRASLPPVEADLMVPRDLLPQLAQAMVIARSTTSSLRPSTRLRHLSAATIYSADLSCPT